MEELDGFIIKELTERTDPIQLTARMVWQRMDALLQEFSSSAVYYQWNSTLDELAGAYI